MNPTQPSTAELSRLPADLACEVLGASCVPMTLLDSSGQRCLWANRAFFESFANQGPSPALSAIGGSPPGWNRNQVRLAGGELLVEFIRTTDSSERMLGGRVDALTQVLTRAAFDQVFQAWFASREGHPFALVFLDLVGFKGINDNYGHLCGDECLRQVGHRLTSLVRTQDVVGRYGGDEFLLLLAGVRDFERFGPIEARIRAAIGRPYTTKEGPLVMGTSLGVAFSNAEISSAADMIHQADRAMYADKRAASTGHEVGRGDLSEVADSSSPG